ncbi:MAG: helix-turn-helix domain-containing protein [Lachnospiraceae bacterium]
MILADKIINERKKNGWSQEELAEQLSVSRQSVSKWEGAQAVPDLQKILKMAEIFNVSTDYLLKDEMEPEGQYIQNTMTDVPTVNGAVVNERPAPRKVSMEEANEFLKIQESNATKTANAVSLCIISPALLIFLAGISEVEGFFITENMAAGIGVVTLLALVAVAVYSFITCDARVKDYEFLEREEIETEYGVTGMVTQRKKEYESKHTNYIALGVVLCIVSALPLLTAAMMELSEWLIVSAVSVLLIIVAVAVNLIVRVSMIWEGYEKLLQENEYTVGMKKKSPVIALVAQIYWGIVVAIYLGWSFVTMQWEFTWIVWPVAGVLFGVVSAVAGIIVKDN